MFPDKKPDDIAMLSESCSQFVWESRKVVSTNKNIVRTERRRTRKYLEMIAGGEGEAME